MIKAIPLNINGLITPMPLRQFDGIEVAKLKEVFPPESGQLTDFSAARMRKLSPQVIRQSTGYSQTQAEQLFKFVQPVHQRSQALCIEGACYLSGRIDLYSKDVAAETVQLGGSGHIHVDGSVMKYRADLAQGIIEIRGLMVSDGGPEIFDMTSHPDALGLLGMGFGLDKIINANHVTHRRAAGGELTLLDPLTPHYAYEMVEPVHRIIVDYRAKMRLPALTF